MSVCLSVCPSVCSCQLPAALVRVQFADWQRMACLRLQHEGFLVLVQEKIVSVCVSVCLSVCRVFALGSEVRVGRGCPPFFSAARVAAALSLPGWGSFWPYGALARQVLSNSACKTPWLCFGWLHSTTPFFRGLARVFCASGTTPLARSASGPFFLSGFPVVGTGGAFLHGLQSSAVGCCDALGAVRGVALCDVPCTFRAFGRVSQRAFV